MGWKFPEDGRNSNMDIYVTRFNCQIFIDGVLWRTDQIFRTFNLVYAGLHIIHPRRENDFNSYLGCPSKSLIKITTGCTRDTTIR